MSKQKIISLPVYLLAFTLSAVFVFVQFVNANETETVGDTVVCTMDAKQCPDGSFVARVAPDCEFAPCPDSSETGDKGEIFRTTARERAELFGKQKEERAEVVEQTKKQTREMIESGASKEDVQELRTETHENMQSLLREQKAERVSLFSEQRKEAREAINERAATLRERLNKQREERKERIESYKARLAEDKQEHFKGIAEKIAERLTNIVDHLEQIANRISLRIEAIEEKGVDLTDAKKELDNTYALMEKARENISLLSDVADDVFTSEDPKSGISELREAVNIVKDSIKEIHTSLSEVVRLIKASFEDERENYRSETNSTSTSEAE